MTIKKTKNKENNFGVEVIDKIEKPKFQIFEKLKNFRGFEIEKFKQGFNSTVKSGEKEEDLKEITESDMNRLNIFKELKHELKGKNDYIIELESKIYKLEKNNVEEDEESKRVMEKFKQVEKRFDDLYLGDSEILRTGEGSRV